MPETCPVVSGNSMYRDFTVPRSSTYQMYEPV
jgi:hypothetical protein